MRDDALVPIDDGTPTAVRRFFFREASPTVSPAETIQWWEKRRLPYNLAVGAAGLTTLTIFNVLGAIGPNTRAMVFPLVPILVYGLLANIMYTGGWVSELLLRPLFGRKTPVVGATIFRYGFVFAVALTSLPIGIAFIEFGLRVLSDIIN
ncbi:MAG: hypothetical protein H7066_09235 [Cytophagaceae bacterium]|nr:hypothetical protein [Gemmatimonadaceae bacterium]